MYVCIYEGMNTFWCGVLAYFGSKKSDKKN